MGTLKLIHSSYIKKVLDKFNLTNVKPMKIPLVVQFKLSKKQLSNDDDELKIMSRVPYASMIGSLMYIMVCMRPNIAYVVGAMSRCMVNLDKQY